MEFDTFLLGKDKVEFTLVRTPRGEVAPVFDFVGPDGKLIVAKDKRITAKTIPRHRYGGIKQIAVPDEFLVGRVVANIMDEATGGQLANANDSRDPARQVARSRHSDRRDCTPMKLDRGALVSNTLRVSTEPASRQAARIAIYHMMRPGEPPTEEAVEICSTACSLQQRYDLSGVGRMKIQSPPVAHQERDRIQADECKGLASKAEAALKNLAEASGFALSSIQDLVGLLPYGARAVVENATLAEVEGLAAKLKPLGANIEVREQLTLSPRDV